MNRFQEVYEEVDNIGDYQIPEEKYEYQPEYNMVQEYYYNQNPSGYQKARYISRENLPYNNAQQRLGEYYNYYSSSNITFNENNQNKNKNKRFNTPDRISNDYTNYIGITNRMNNLRGKSPNPLNNRVNIKKNIYKGSQTPKLYAINTNTYSNQDEEYLDNYQYHETKNIKNKGNKKYDSITHITGYSNLIPLNRMKNLYGNNYNYNNGQYMKENNLNNIETEENKPKIKTAIQKIQELQRGKREYDEFMKRFNSKSDQNYAIKQEKLRQERKIKEEELKLEKIKEERIREERKRQEEELKLEKLKNEELREERLRKERLRQVRMRQENNLSEDDIENYRNNNQDKENIRRRVIQKNTKIAKYKKIPIQSNVNNFSYISNNKNNINNINNNKYNSSYREKITKIKKTNQTRNNNSYNRINNSNIENNKYILNRSNYSSRENNINSNSNFGANKNKIISYMKVEQKTASLNFPNQNKKVDTYGENFDKEKYTREYVNIENVEDGRIENHVETGISKDGQYLISVTSAQKIFDPNKIKDENEYEDENENEEEEEIYEKEEINEDNNKNLNELPEKNVQEIISTVTTKRRNLGDNYKYYESKNLIKPNITSFTKHKRWKERTIYGNEEHETKEVKTYKIRPQINEYGEKTQQIIETGKIPYQEEMDHIEGEEDYDQENVNNDEGEEEEGRYENIEENYMEEEAY